MEVLLVILVLSSKEISKKVPLRSQIKEGGYRGKTLNRHRNQKALTMHIANFIAVLTKRGSFNLRLRLVNSA